MRRFLHCVGAIRCPAPRALRALLQPCIQFCDGLHPHSLSPLHQGYDIVGFHAPQWLVLEHIAFEERAVERACTIGKDGYTHGRRARGDCRRHHGHVDGIIELEEVGELPSLKRQMSSKPRWETIVSADCWCHTAGPSRSCYGRLGDHWPSHRVPRSRR
jgi:hypothetical protein